MDSKGKGVTPIESFEGAGIEGTGRGEVGCHCHDRSVAGGWGKRGGLVLEVRTTRTCLVTWAGRNEDKFRRRMTGCGCHLVGGNEESVKGNKGGQRGEVFRN